MAKILGAMVAAAVLAAVAFFGFEFYVQQQAAGDVEAAFAALRASGAKASHGRVSFDLWSRTITVADIAAESAAQPPVTVKIGRFTASGVRQPEAGRFAADRIEAADAEIAGTMGSAQTRLPFVYKAPRIEAANYTGPAGPLRKLDPAAPGDLVRFMFEHFAAISATAITAPTVTGNMTAPGTAAAGLGDYTYSGIAMRDIRAGRIAGTTVDRVAFTATMDAAGKKEKLTGEVVELSATDFDAAATLALFDPARAKDDKLVLAYRQMKAGAYTAAFESGLKFRIDGMTANEIGVKPSKLQFPQLMAIVEAAPPPGTTPTPDQMRELLDKVAALYEGMYFGGAEVRGLAMETPEGPLRLAAIRLGKFEGGKLAEFAIEGLEAQSKQGPVYVGPLAARHGSVKIDRFAFRALDVANLMRMSAQLSATRNPSPDQLIALLLLLDGAEIRGLTAPMKDTGQPVNIDTLSLAWGQFVGPLPTRARVTLKMSGPVDASDPEPFNLLADAGMREAAVNIDLGAAWNETTRAFSVEPMTFELGSLLTAAARVSFANVAREVFSLNPLQAAIMAAQVEAGPLEIALRDNGGIELIVAQHARSNNVTREAARAAIVENVRDTGMKLAGTSADAMAIAGAVARFVERPGGTLTVKLTPKGKVPLMQLVDAMRTTPLLALMRFQVDASNGR